MIAPDIFETAGRALSYAPPKPRKPKQSALAPTPPPTPSSPLGKPAPPLGKKDNHTVITNNPKPEEIQAGLDAALAHFVDTAPTPELKASTLIKIGSYQVELTKYAPMLRDADVETARETLAEWIDAGDAEMKKALVNAYAGTEDFPLLKVAIAEEGPEYELAKMLDGATNSQTKAALLQKIAFYSTQINEMLGRGDLLKVDPAQVDTAVADWIAEGDGTHLAMKKAIAAHAAMRRAAAVSPGENEAVDEKAGNAATNAGAKLGNPPDKTYVPRSSADGAGPRLRASRPVPGQDDGESPNPTSGPNDTGDGGVTSTTKIRRKGTTGGLGSVAGADGDATSMSAAGADGGKSDGTGDEQGRGGKKKKKAAMDKGADLAGELIKVAPDAMITMLAELSPEDQVTACQMAAQDAADLMAWSAAQDPTRLQKAELDAAITDWLSADPDPRVIQLKKHTAEALATAEEIPVSLANAIMGWQAPPVAPGIRVRQPHRAAA